VRQKAVTPTTWMYILGHILPTQNTTRHSVLLTGCMIKGKGHCVYMDRWFSSPKIFNHLWGCKTKAVGTVMSKRKEMPKQAFSGKLKKSEEISRQQHHILDIKWKDIRDVFFLTTAHEDVLVEAPSSMGAHHKIKPAAVLDYCKHKTGVDRSDQMLSYYAFESKTIKWWKKLFFHLFDLVVLNAHILHNKMSKKKCHWKFSMKKSLKVCSLVPVLKFKSTARPAVQMADL